MDIHEKVEVGVHVFPHVAVEEADFCLVCLFSVFFNDITGFVSDF